VEKSAHPKLKLTNVLKFKKLMIHKNTTAWDVQCEEGFANQTVFSKFTLHPFKPFSVANNTVGDQITVTLNRQPMVW